VGLILIASDAGIDLEGEPDVAFVAAGHQIVNVARLDTAQEVLRTRAVDALVVDDVVDACSAESFLEALVDPPPIAVVVSAWATVARIRRSAATGFNLHVVKPCGATVIADAVSLMLRLRADGRYRADAFDVIRFGSVFAGARDLRVGT
jgi:DNA-binding NarL/FixJ family response regulator